MSQPSGTDAGVSCAAWVTLLGLLTSTGKGDAQRPRLSSCRRGCVSPRRVPVNICAGACRR